MILAREFFHRNTVDIARDLLGKRLVMETSMGRISGIINEVEAYRGSDDPGSHAYPGITPRNRIMHETYGHAYIYFIYGMYYCLNFTTEGKGIPGAVLIRSVIPDEGVEMMLRNRGKETLNNLSNGPGKLCKAFGITKIQNGLSLEKDSGIYVEDIDYKINNPIQIGKRIGLSQGKDLEWRFWFSV